MSVGSPIPSLSVSLEMEKSHLFLNPIPLSGTTIAAGGRGENEILEPLPVDGPPPAWCQLCLVWVLLGRHHCTHGMDKDTKAWRSTVLHQCGPAVLSALHNAASPAEAKRLLLLGVPFFR